MRQPWRAVCPRATKGATHGFDEAASATASEGTTTITLDTAPALITAIVGPFGRFGVRQELAGVSGVLDWDERTYESTATFRDPSGNGASTQLSFMGTIPNVPPQADAGADQSFECTANGRATVTLRASGTDPDGDDDLAGYAWSREVDGTWIVSPGQVLTTPFRLGVTNVILTAFDSARAKDMDGLKIEVVDTLAPEIVGIDVTPGSVWPADGRLHLFRLGQEIEPTVTDACDPSPAVRIVEASGNGELAYGDEAICIRAAAPGFPNPIRRYTVTVAAVDASGNVTTDDVLVTSSDDSLVVADDDPRCP